MRAGEETENLKMPLESIYITKSDIRGTPKLNIRPSTRKEKRGAGFKYFQFSIDGRLVCDGYVKEGCEEELEPLKQLLIVRHAR